jgi:hypothetical protein
MSRTRLTVESLEDRCLLTSAQYVTSLYVDFLNRGPSAAEVASYVTLLNTGTSTVAVARAFANSDEFRNIETQRDYLGLLGRSASPAELAFWLQQRHAGLSNRQEVAAILASDEFFAHQGGSATGWLTGAFVAVLGRAPDGGAQAAFLGAGLQTGAGRGRVATIIVFSPEANGRLVQSAFALLLNRPADPAGLAFWTAQLNGGLSQTDLLANLAGSTEYVVRKGGGLDVVRGATTTTTTQFTTPTPFIGNPVGPIPTGTLFIGNPVGAIPPFLGTVMTFGQTTTTGFTSFGGFPLGFTVFGFGPFGGAVLL